MAVVRVAVVGPESSGKSTLCGMLARALRLDGVGAAVVGEYAREYYTHRPYDPSDPGAIAEVALGQQAAEDAASAALGDGVLLCDTTALTCRVWAEEAVGSVPRQVLDLERLEAYALHLVTTPLTAWAPDPLRVMPDAGDRGRVFRRHVLLLRVAGAPYAVVSGSTADERLAAGLRAVRGALAARTAVVGR